MKKLVALMMVLTMTLSLAGCGEKAAPAPAPAPAPAAAPAKPAAAPTPAPAATPAAAPAASEETTYTIDYKDVASWVDSGFIGQDESGAPVVMAIDEANETAIIIFGDNSDMTAVSFLGAITYTDTTGTIVDETTKSSLTFGVKKIDQKTIELDMGDIGKATIKASSKDEVLKTIKNAIENYKHVG